ncbi:MAG TPA: hypothetical protein V6D28_24165 [Leptolyngbyaceae cyanobacterium]
MAKKIVDAKLKWQSLLSTVKVDLNLGDRVFIDLITAYSTRQRYYHNLAHVEQVLEVIEKMRSHSRNFPAIQFAAWFHDIIYDPKAKDNEEKSAAYAAKALTSLGITSIIDKVSELILITKSHQLTDNEDIDSQILLDADLSILGTSAPEYRIYANAIRQEYAWLCESEYRTGRIKVLEKFLQRKRIYYTEEMFANLELTARQNIEEEIKFLSAVNDYTI